jgi:hypothetical protein
VCLLPVGHLGEAWAIQQPLPSMRLPTCQPRQSLFEPFFARTGHHDMLPNPGSEALARWCIHQSLCARVHRCSAAGHNLLPLHRNTMGSSASRWGTALSAGKTGMHWPSSMDFALCQVIHPEQSIDVVQQFEPWSRVVLRENTCHSFLCDGISSWDRAWA